MMTHGTENCKHVHVQIYHDSSGLFQVRMMKLQRNGVHKQIDGYWKSDAFRVGENRESNAPQTVMS